MKVNIKKICLEIFLIVNSKQNSEIYELSKILIYRKCI